LRFLTDANLTLSFHVADDASGHHHIPQSFIAIAASDLSMLGALARLPQFGLTRLNMRRRRRDVRSEIASIFHRAKVGIDH